MNNNPLPSNHPEVARSQHVVPQTYMKQWSHKDPFIYVYDKRSYKPSIKERSVKSINYIDNTYDFLPGDIYIPQEGLDEMYSFLDGYDIQCEGKSLKSHQEMNSQYLDIDKWVISKNGKVIDSKEVENIESKLSSARYCFIESEWGKQYENQWVSHITDLEFKLRNKCDLTDDDLQLVMKYLLMFDFRSESKNDFIEECFGDASQFLLDISDGKDYSIPENDRVHPEEDTALKQMRGNYYRRQYYDYLRYGTGVISVVLDAYLKKFELGFFLNYEQVKLITSNNPVFVHLDDTNHKQKFFIATPTLMILLGKRVDSEPYMICKMGRDTVDRMNGIVYQDNDLIILPTSNYNIESLQQ